MPDMSSPTRRLTNLSQDMLYTLPRKHGRPYGADCKEGPAHVTSRERVQGTAHYR
jgi:hypothetical protein